MRVNGVGRGQEQAEEGHAGRQGGRQQQGEEAAAGRLLLGGSRIFASCNARWLSLVSCVSSRPQSLWVNWNGGGNGDGMHWDTRTTQGGDGTRFSGVIGSWFAVNTYVHTIWTADAGGQNQFYKNGRVPPDGVVPAAAHVDLHEEYWLGRVDNFYEVKRELTEGANPRPTPHTAVSVNAGHDRRGSVLRLRTLRQRRGRGLRRPGGHRLTEDLRDLFGRRGEWPRLERHAGD